MANECGCFVNLPSDSWGNEVAMMGFPVFNVGKIDFFYISFGGREPQHTCKGQRTVL